MGVYIEEINIEDSGPISDLQLQLGPFNLIYGHNERGKTFLVEFLIRSLFKNRSGYSLREAGGRGKVVLTGLSNGPLSFTSSSKKKLEDHLAEDEPGMPAQISHLLVVKGAELDFDDKNRSGIDKNVLKDFLSGQGVLDVIQKEISVTVCKASIENGQIIGNQLGEIKTRSILQRSIQALDKRFEDIETIYSNSERSKLEIEISELQEKIDDQELAKRHLAFLINQEINDIQSRLDRMPEDELGKLDDDFKALKNTQRNISKHAKKLAELELKSEHYEWLEQAIPLYEQRGSQTKNKLSGRYPILVLVLLILALLFSLIGFPVGAALSILGVAVVGWLFWRQSREALDQAIDVDEVKRLEVEFQSRFGRPLTGLPIMLEEKKKMEGAYHGLETQRKNLQEEEDDLAQYQDQITSVLKRLSGQTVEQEEWAETIRKMLQDQKQLREQLAAENVKSAALAVDPSAYRSEPVNFAYDSELLAAFDIERTALQESLDDKTADLDTLKQRICDQTGDSISASWETVIRNLQLKREEVAADYCRITAKVMAGILVNQALDSIRTQEDMKIREKLSSPLVGAPIEQITGRYTGVRYNNGKLLVDDPYGYFPISHLSTGAREQVLLGLRLGFAAQIFGRDRLFLILDDAFQHADWQRRERLLHQMVDLARGGWQIIYLTMDDHIKKLFDAAGKQNFGENYRSYDLNEGVIFPETRSFRENP